jgi:hypothetical protein
MLVKLKPSCYSENSSLDCSFRMSIELWNNSTIDLARTLEKKPITEKSDTRDTVILSRGSAKYNTCLLPRCGVPMDEGCTQPLSSDPMIHLNHGFFPYSCFPVCEESPQVGASHPCKVDHNKRTRVREGKKHTHTSQDMSTKTRRREFTT